VEKRLYNIFESLRTKVVTLYDGVKTMVLVDRKVALGALWFSLYFPYETMAPLFEAYSDLEKGNGLKLYAILASTTGNLTVTCQDCHPLVAHAGASPDADISIQCTDSGATPDDLASVRSIYDGISAQTHLADIIFGVAVRCVCVVVPQPFQLEPTFLTPPYTCRGWSLESKTRFGGTLGGNTSFPLLFIGNTHGTSPFYGRGFHRTNYHPTDNITPLQG